MVLSSLMAKRESVQDLQDEVVDNTTYAETYNNMGDSLIDQGKVDEAVEAYKKALGIEIDKTVQQKNVDALNYEQNIPKPFTDYAEELDASKPTIATGVGQDLKIQENDYRDIARVRGEIPDRKGAFVNPNVRSKQVRERMDDVKDLREEAQDFGYFKDTTMEGLNNIALKKYREEKNQYRIALYDQFIALNLSPHLAWQMVTQKENWVPGVGEALMAEDARLAFQQGTKQGIIAGLVLTGGVAIGTVPVFGDVAAKALKMLSKRIQRGGIDVKEAKHLLETIPFHKLDKKHRIALRGELEDIILFHGTQKRGIKKFNMSAVGKSAREGGTGQGANTFGFGLYFGGIFDIGNEYRHVAITSRRKDEMRKIKEEGEPGDWESVVKKVGKGTVYSTKLNLHPSELLDFEAFMFEQGGNKLKLVNREFGNVVDTLPPLDSGAWTTTTEFKPHHLTTDLTVFKPNEHMFDTLGTVEKAQVEKYNRIDDINFKDNLITYNFNPFKNEIANNIDQFKFLWEQPQDRLYWKSSFMEYMEKLVNPIPGEEPLVNKLFEVGMPDEIAQDLFVWSKGVATPQETEQLYKSIIPYIPKNDLEKLITNLQTDWGQYITGIKSIDNSPLITGKGRSPEVMQEIDASIQRIRNLDNAKSFLNTLEEKYPVGIKITPTIELDERLNFSGYSESGKNIIIREPKVEGYRLDMFFNQLRKEDFQDNGIWHNSGNYNRHRPESNVSSFLRVFPELQQTFKTIEEAQQVASIILNKIKYGEVKGGDFNAYVQAKYNFSKPQVAEYLSQEGIHAMRYLSEWSRPGRKFGSSKFEKDFNYLVWNDELIESSDIQDPILGTFRNPDFTERDIKKSDMRSSEQKLFEPNWEKKLNWRMLQTRARLLDAKEAIANYRKKILGFNKGGLVDADRDTIGVNFIMGI